MRLWSMLGCLLIGISLEPAEARAADEIVIRIDVSKPGVHELLEPLRMSCVRSSMSFGQSQEKALAEVNDCLAKRFLAAVELERSIRVLYPADLKPEQLKGCIDEVDEDRPLLPCVQRKGLR